MPRAPKTSEKKPAAVKPRKRTRAKKVEAAEVSAPVVVETKPKIKKRTYLFAVGRRKSAVARVRYHKKGEGVVTVNGLPYKEYFPTLQYQIAVTAPLDVLNFKPEGDITIKVQGGGKRGQAESVRHGIARVLLLVDPAFRTTLKQAGYLIRDPRVKERKKYGLKRARRAPQWQKR